MVPLPPVRPPQAELDKLGTAPSAAPATIAPITPKPAAAAPQEGDILDDIGAFLESIFGGGGQGQYPGYEWDALNGWVPSAGKDNAGMQAAAQAAIAPPAAPDQPKLPVQGSAVPNSGMPKANLPAPAAGVGMGSQRIDMQPAVIPEGFGGAPSSTPGRFK